MKILNATAFQAKSLAMQVDAPWQGLANASFLAMPAFVIAASPSEHIHVLEVISLLVWMGAFAMESVSGMKKLRFLLAMKKSRERNRVCNVGLWKYKRHPNYFAKWMVWNALIIAAIPSWLALYDTESFIVWALLGVGLLLVLSQNQAVIVSTTFEVIKWWLSIPKTGVSRYTGVITSITNRC